MNTTDPHHAAREREAARLEALADATQGAIDHKRAPLTQNWTHRRAGIKDGQHRTADRLEEVQHGLRALARALRENVLPGTLAGCGSKSRVAHILSGYPRTKADDYALRDLRALISRYALDDTDARAQRESETAKRKKLDELRTIPIPGFFPTPPDVVERVFELAEMETGRRYNILEPSAGIGSLAAPFLAHVQEHGGGIVVCEIVSRLIAVLKDEGYGLLPGAVLLDGDCRAVLPYVQQGRVLLFDRIVMNPPFEKRQDYEHVVAMREHLAPGGILVAIVTPRGAEALQSLFGYLLRREPLPEGAFTGAAAFRQTGVRAEIVVIRRAA